MFSIILVGCSMSSHFIDMNNPKQTAENISQWCFGDKQMTFVQKPKATDGEAKLFYTPKKNDLQKMLQVHVKDNKVNYITVLFNRDDDDKVKQFIEKIGIARTENIDKTISGRSEKIELEHNDCIVFIQYYPSISSYIVTLKGK